MNVFDHASQRMREGGLKEFCAALDEAVVCCDPSAEVFVKIDKWKNEDSLCVLHLAVVKGSWAAARDIRIKHAGWIGLGEVAEPTSVIVERLGCEFNKPWSNSTHAFVDQKWRAHVRFGLQYINFDVSAPEHVWPLVEPCKEDITEQAVKDWEALAAVDGCVDFAYLQVLPDRVE